MKKTIAGLPALLIILPFMVFADHSLPEGVTESEAVQNEECHIGANLTVGSRGAEVSCLQEHLIKEKHLGLANPTGYYGSLTKAAVAKWQDENGIVATGFFGELSRIKFAAHDEGVAPAAVPHPHPAIDIGRWPATSSVSVTLHPDSMSGWNLEATTTNFRFAPEHVNGTVVPNEGHMHLYVDGKKISRVYGNWQHLPKELFVGAGTHVVLVTLNANDHSDLSLNGARVEAKTEVVTN